MSNYIKVCNPVKYPNLLESDPVSDRFSGGASEQVNKFLDYLEVLTNLTFVFDGTYPGIGSRINDTDFFDGCLGQLQRNEADILFSGMDYPMDVLNVTEGYIYFDEKISFFGLFPRPSANKIADFSRSINSFHWSVYLLIFAFLIIFTIFVKVRSRMIIHMCRPIILSRKKSSKILRPLFFRRRMVLRTNSSQRISFIDILRHYSGSSFIETNSFVISVTIMVLNIFSFIIFAYFNSLLNTDLVVPERVEIFENYDQIIESGIKPVFIQGSTYYKDLKFAPEGSKSKMFWNWAVEKFGEEKLFATANYDFIFKIDEIMRKEIIFFSGEHWLKLMKNFACDLLGRNYEKFVRIIRQSDDFDYERLSEAQVYIRSDESAIKKVKQFIIRKESSKFEKLFFKARYVFRLFIESGFIKKNIDYNSIQILDFVPDSYLIIGPKVPKRSEIKQICLEHNSPYPKTPTVDHVIPSHLKLSFLTCGTLIFIAFLRLLYEMKSSYAT